MQTRNEFKNREVIIKSLKLISFYMIVLISCDFSSNLESDSKVKIKKEADKEKIIINQIIGFNSKNAGFEFCLDKAIKHPYSKKMDIEIKLKNEKQIHSIYQKILAPSISKAKEGRRCFEVNILKQTTHQRHPQQKDVEIINMINTNWNKDSIEYVNLIIYKSTHSDKIYATKKFGLN